MNINVDKLQELIENNYVLANSKRKKLDLLTRRETVVEKEENTSSYSEESVNADKDIYKTKDLEMDEFISLYNGLDINYSKDDLLSILPDISNNRYDEIILRLKAESLKEMHELYELCSLENNKDEYLSAINFHANKMKLLDECNKPDIDNPSETRKNKIILVPTTGGNIRLIEELSHIPFEYYPDFLQLINSIVDGSFKNFKRFTGANNKLKSISEVKGFQVRVAFSRIGVDSYALISAFVKKSDIDKAYVETLIKKVSDYYNIKDSLIKNLDNEEFIKENNKNVSELYNLLNSYSNNNNDSKKGGLIG
ncbi:MAG: hypothetical protein IKF37_01415 [Bacilli bacterium]|nr:hypothetical protein [Bacilli bacterium]